MLGRLKSAYRAISPIALGTPLILVDIGAAGGLQPKWRRYRHQTRPVMVEPNPEEAARLRSASDTIVVENGLAAEAGIHTLNIAHWFGCSSMLDTDPETLAGYKIAPLYATEQQVTVDCKRYDELYREGKVPAPDAIKVDVEGYEYQVLSGFGDLLHGVLGIEAEAWFYPVFKGPEAAARPGGDAGDLRFAAAASRESARLRRRHGLRQRVLHARQGAASRSHARAAAEIRAARACLGTRYDLRSVLPVQ